MSHHDKGCYKADDRIRDMNDELDGLFGTIEKMLKRPDIDEINADYESRVATKNSKWGSGLKVRSLIISLAE